MLEYPKGKEPRQLVEWQTTPGATWASLDGSCRQEIREKLCRDQGCLCAYCERRIRPEEGGAFIEHWLPRSLGEDELKWSNMVGVCSGRSPETLHCDKSRPPETLLYLHPVQGRGPSPRRYLRYLASGRVEARDGSPEDVGRDIDDYLNLNAPHLQRARKVVYDALRARLTTDSFSPAALKREKQRHTLKPGGKLPEQAELVLYQIDRWLVKSKQNKVQRAKGRG